MESGTTDRQGSESGALTVVIPALDEEQAIGDTLRRCLEARSRICSEGGVTRVEIVVVSDGSSDGTEAIARSFDDVSVLAFDRNRGYGAAIKSGFRYRPSELVAFLDADGTCDPVFFGPLSAACLDDGADLALGNRMGPGSEMPRVRSVGNRIFAWILGVLSQKAVTDTASGMRVIRQSALGDLYPLPDGLHFTPAMSAKALLSGNLTLVEIPMTYAERMGRSKLSVVKDGVRFLRCIIEAAMCFRPDRPLFLAAGVTALIGVLLSVGPLVTWVRSGALHEWMIYRVMASALALTLSALLVNGAVVAARVAAEAHGRQTAGLSRWAGTLFSGRGRLVVGLTLGGAALAVSWPGLVEYVATGHVTMHWSRVVLSSLLIVVASVIGITSFLLGMLELIQAQRGGELPSEQPDRVRAAGGGAP